MKDVGLEDGVGNEEDWRSSFAFVVDNLIVLAYQHVIVLTLSLSQRDFAFRLKQQQRRCTWRRRSLTSGSLADLVVCTASARTASNKGIKAVVGMERRDYHQDLESGRGGTCFVDFDAGLVSFLCSSSFARFSRSACMAVII